MVLIYGLITQQTDFDNNKCCCYVFPGKPEGADGEEMETSSHMDTQVSTIGENKHVPHFINLTSLKLPTDHFKCNMFVVDQIVCQGDLMLKWLSKFHYLKYFFFFFYIVLKDQPEDSTEQSAPASPSSSQTKDGLFKEPLVMPDSEPHDENLTEQTHHIIIPSYASWFDYNRYSTAK